MNKKGFTLIELLTVIVLLAIIAVITTPVIINAVDGSRGKAYKEQVRLVTNAAERWGAEHFREINQKQGCYLTVDYLSKEGYLSTDSIKNPKDPKNDMQVVDITNNNGKFTYQYKESSDFVISCAETQEGNIGQ